MISQQTQTLLNEIALRHGREIKMRVEQALIKYKRTGELADSVELTIVPATNTESPKIVITYADQGYFIGQRNPQWTKMPPIEDLQKWVAAGVTLNGEVPGYKNGLAPNLPPWKATLRKLWAIAKSKQKFDKHTRKPWKKQAKLGELIKDLNADAIAKFSEEVEHVLTEALQRPKE